MTYRHFASTLPYKYTNNCVYDRGWDDFSLAARGLILDAGAQRIVATPFPQFFNLGEMDETIPDQPYEVYEKLDGSRIILFHHGDRWNAVTRGRASRRQAAGDSVPGPLFAVALPERATNWKQNVSSPCD